MFTSSKQHSAHASATREAHNQIIPIDGFVPFEWAIFEWAIIADLTPMANGLYTLVLKILDAEDTVCTSNTVLAKIDIPVAVLFPPISEKTISQNSYGISRIEMEYTDENNAVIPSAMGVCLTNTANGLVLNLINTEIKPVWIIGARDITAVVEPIGTLASEEETAAVH